ncbi:MAG: hypothetical protein ABL886_10740 [Rhodoglobus sp.]
MTTKRITTVPLAAVALVTCALAQSESRPNLLPLVGLEQFPGSAAAAEQLRRQGFVVSSDTVLPETGKPPRQLFEGYLDSRVPTVITADLVLDGFFALQGRVLVEIDEAMAGSLRALAAAIGAVADKADSALLRELSGSVTTMLEEPGVSVEALLGRYKLVGELLPPAALTNSAMPRGYVSSALEGSMRARKLLQLCRFDMARKEDRKAAQLLHDDPDVKVAVSQLTQPLTGILGDALGSCVFSEVDSDSGLVGLLPCFATPLDGMWDAIDNPPSLLPIVVQSSGVDQLPTEASFSGTVWNEWMKGYRDQRSLEQATVQRLVDALRLLQEPDPHAASPFDSTEWRLLQANAQLASLACNERQMSPYTDLRVRALVANDGQPFVAPFSKHFAALGGAAQSLGLVRKQNLQVGMRAAAPDKLLERDLEEFVSICRTLADVCVMQSEKRALGQDQSEALAAVGAAMARMHGYVGNSCLSPRDDHQREVFVGVGRDGRGLTIGVGRPETLFVLIDRGSGPVLHRGMVFSYRESTSGEDSWQEGGREVGVPDAFQAYRSAR